MSVDQESHGSDWSDDRMIDMLRGILERRRNVIAFQIGEIRKDVRRHRTAGQHIEDILDPYSHSSDARTAAKDVRVGRDAVEMRRHAV